jgi:hypothetical protein
MAGEKFIPDQTAVDHFMSVRSAWLVSRALHVAAELGVADALSDGPKTADQLAEATGAHPQSLYRLLRLLAAHGVFEGDAAGRFNLTSVGALLRTDALRDAARINGDAIWNAYGALLHSIKTGEAAFQRVHGVGFFDYLSSNREANTSFNHGMAKVSTTENSAIAKAYDFVGFRRVVDVGGGQGGLIAEILKAYPATRGVLFDLPQVVASPHYLKEAGVQDRCEIVAGSFFETMPRGGDAYVLKRVIHDWNDEICQTVLRKCRDAVADGGRIIVVEAVVPAGNEPHPSKASDLLMLVLGGGQERTEKEFRQLFESSGLKLNRIIPTSSIMSIVEAECA